ncbi:MAG: holo-ACP synthase [Longimicrobiales bacterium]|nr:holo-ACP synthase [Longimicrobiales bacterium]
MIAGIGLDLVRVDRMRRFHQRWGQRGLARVFTARELDYCLGHVDPASSLAARFAAKEAFFKAVGTGWGVGGALVEVEVRRGATGDPDLAVRGRAAETLARNGARHVHVTLTHTADTAAAVVILER